MIPSLDTDLETGDTLVTCAAYIQYGMFAGASELQAEAAHSLLRQFNFAVAPRRMQNLVLDRLARGHDATIST